MSKPSLEAIEHFNRASEARTNKNLDLAITEFDACLSSSPNLEIIFFTLCYCWEVIFERFDFFNREGASLSDYEVAWSLRAQHCLNKAIEIYELNYDGFTDDKVQIAKEYYFGTRDRSNDWMPYGGMKYDANGEKQPRDFDAVQQVRLPMLSGLESVLNRKVEKNPNFNLENLLRDDPPRYAKHLLGKALGLQLGYALRFDENSDFQKMEMLHKIAVLYEQAIKVGLPQDLTIKSYGECGIVLAKLAGFKRELSSSDWELGLQNFPDAWRAMQCLEYAFYLDSKEDGSVFGNTSPSKDSLPDSTRSLLSDMLFYLDYLTAFQCESLRTLQGDKSVIPFVLEKLRNLGYLKFLPFRWSCIELATSFYNLGDKNSAIHWLNCILSDVEDFADLKSNSSEDRINTKERARNRIAEYSSSSNQNIAKNRYSGISILAAIGTFFLLFFMSVLLATLSSGGTPSSGGCCFPLIAAIIVYFITPYIMTSLRKG